MQTYYSLLARTFEGATSPKCFTDLDGVLARLRGNPARARVTARTRGPLERLDALIPVTAVSGRTPPVVRKLLRLPNIRIEGEHGTAWLEPRTHTLQRDLAVHANIPVLEQFLEDHAAALATGGIRIQEDEGPAVRSLHAGHGRKSGEGWDLLEGLAHDARERGLHATFLRGCLNLRTTDFSKAWAAKRLVEGGVDAALMLGDDLSDIALWHAMRQLLPDRCLAVGVINRHGPERELREAADICIRRRRVPGLLKATVRYFTV